MRLAVLKASSSDAIDAGMQRILFAYSLEGSQVALRSKALHLSLRGGSNPGGITSSFDLESLRAAHNWPSIVVARLSL